MKQTYYKQPALYSIILLLSLGFTWGTSFSIAKFTIGSGIHPLGYSFWQSFGPAVLIFLVTSVSERKIVSFGKKHIYFYFLCGLFGITLPNLIMYYSATHVPSGILGLIVNTSPIITYFFSIIFAIEKYILRKLIGVVLGFVGMLFLFLPKISSVGELNWILFCFLVPVFLSFCTIIMVKLRPQKSSSLALSCGMLIAATCMIFPVTLLNNEFYLFKLPLQLPDYFIILEIFLSSLGYILFFELLRVAGPVYYSLVGCIVVLSGLFWGYLIFQEKIKGNELISICFIFIAIYLIVSRNTFSNNIKDS